MNSNALRNKINKRREGPQSTHSLEKRKQLENIFNKWKQNKKFQNKIGDPKQVTHKKHTLPPNVYGGTRRRQLKKRKIKRKTKRKTKRNKRDTKKNKKIIIGGGTCGSSNTIKANCINTMPTAKAQKLNSATRTSFIHGLIPLAKAKTPEVAAYNVPVYKK